MFGCLPFSYGSSNKVLPVYDPNSNPKSTNNYSVATQPSSSPFHNIAPPPLNVQQQTQIIDGSQPQIKQIPASHPVQYSKDVDKIKQSVNMITTTSMNTIKSTHPTVVAPNRYIPNNYSTDHYYPNTKTYLFMRESEIPSSQYFPQNIQPISISADPKAPSSAYLPGNVYVVPHVDSDEVPCFYLPNNLAQLYQERREANLVSDTEIYITSSVQDRSNPIIMTMNSDTNQTTVTQLVDPLDNHLHPPDAIQLISEEENVQQELQDPLSQQNATDSKDLNDSFPNDQISENEYINPFGDPVLETTNDLDQLQNPPVLDNDMNSGFVEPFVNVPDTTQQEFQDPFSNQDTTDLGLVEDGLPYYQANDNEYVDPFASTNLNNSDFIDLFNNQMTNFENEYANPYSGAMDFPAMNNYSTQVYENNDYDNNDSGGYYANSSDY